MCDYIKVFPGGSDSKKSICNVGDLGSEDPVKGMATHSRILAWRILWTEVKSLKSYSYYQHVYV